VKRRTGGRWDPNAGPVYFFAASANALARASVQPYVLLAVNEMMTDNENGTVELLLQGLIRNGNHVFVDSGIFWLTNIHKREHGITMNEALALHPKDIDGFDALFDRYVEVARRYGNDVWGYIELDQGGVNRKRETRRELESMGLAPIPVYHPLNDGRDYLEELMCEYDRICFGNIVQANRAVRQRLLHVMWEARCRHPDVWIHILGLTPSEVSLAFPSNSADSSSWLTGVRWHRAERERAMLKGISGYPRNQAYLLGDSDSHAYAYDQAVASYATIGRTWEAVLAERAELGCGPFDMGVLTP
jgi:hypothetical protein